MDLNFCGAQRVATQVSNTVRTIDSHGNSLPPLTPQSSNSNNNASPVQDEVEKFTCINPAGKFIVWDYFLIFLKLAKRESFILRHLDLSLFSFFN